MAELRQSGQRKPRTQQAETSQPNRQDRRRRRYGPRRFPYQQPQPSTDADGCITVQRKNRWTPRIKHGLVATTNAGTTAPDVPTVDLDVVMTEATTVDSIPHLEGVVQEPQAHQAQATHPTRIRTRLVGWDVKHQENKRDSSEIVASAPTHSSPGYSHPSPASDSHTAHPPPTPDLLVLSPLL
ncbi:hypothetical protein Mp_7g04880 [Marchantia polymorpha subsp. ruderalis]|uniref:Uncharacterized protein n=2 Tax=Marchantia polymorpha TaxID=3197 RepID=A0AAF6BW85_MARPO|nr:hypothetical protein MARPO_0062s0038 [Marchantia polymorpha]BBN16269.1 hypothetical protein Mp_7g04880 [Marchantia polymorpha subsp. ruderalis]|eukprot:PTQ36613.1 hypothetical protein MARPO_0062s0038 [Marchantia polymorpha]